MNRAFLPACLMAITSLYGCDILGNDQGDIAFSIHAFDIADPPDLPVGSPSLTPHGRRIAIGGAFRSECQEGALTGDMVRVTPGRFRVTLSESRNTSACTSPFRLFGYTAFIGPVPPGAYHVTVLYRHHGMSPDTVLSGQVDIE